MSNGDVKISYDDLAAGAAGFAREADQIRQAGQRLQSQCGQLQGKWVGKGASVFFKEMDSSVVPAFQRLMKALAEAGVKLKEVSRVFQEGETEASRMVQVQGRDNGSGGKVEETAAAGGSGGGQPATASRPPRNVQEQWAQLSRAEKEQALQKMANDIAKQHGLGTQSVVVEQIPDVQDSSGTTGGDKRAFFDTTDLKIHIDEDNLNDPAIINTVAHETRHAIQGDLWNKWNQWDKLPASEPQWPQGITRQDVQRWNPAQYKPFPTETPPSHGDARRPFYDAKVNAYRNQPVERDARTFGENYFRAMTVERLGAYAQPTPAAQTP